MTPIKLQYITDKYNIIPMSEPIPYKLCVLRDYDKSLDKVWHVEYYIFDQNKNDLVRRRVTLSQDTAKARHAFAKEVISDINEVLKSGAVINPIQKKQVKAVTANTSLIDTCDYFLEFNKSTLKPRTYETYQTDIKRFKNYLIANKIGGMPLQKFNEQDALAFLDYLVSVSKISNRSRNNNKGTLSTLFNFFLKRKIISDNPLSNIDNLSHVKLRHTAFSDIQAAKFKAECIYRGEHQLLLFCQFIYFAFLRPRVEARMLKIGDIKEKTILVNAYNAKENKQEHVMIPEELEKIIAEKKLRNYPEEYYVFGADGLPGPEPLGRDFLYNRHRKILERLNLTGKNIDTYSWKHYGAIKLFKETENVALISAQCRHANVGVTLEYLRDLGQFIDYEQINKFPSF
jgi:integrase